MRRLMVGTILGGLALTGCSNELKGSIQVTAAGQSWSVMPSECAMTMMERRISRRRGEVWAPLTNERSIFSLSIG